MTALKYTYYVEVKFLLGFPSSKTFFPHLIAHSLIF